MHKSENATFHVDSKNAKNPNLKNAIFSCAKNPKP